MRIVVTTWGSLGDLHPYLAVALALRRRGHEIIVGAGECYRERVTALGLGYAPVRPDCDWISDPVRMRRMAHPQLGLIRAAQLPLGCLRESYQDLLRAVDGADLLVANLAMYSARLVAEKRGIPWASAMHIPTGFYSAHDPPVFSGFAGLSHRLRPLGPGFWGPVGSLLKWLARPMARPWYQLRRELQLPPANDLNPVTDSHSPALHLALFSRHLANQQPDWPASTVITGFPWYGVDPEPGLEREIQHFLGAGPAPLVFTLGSVISTDPGEFYRESAEAARVLGCRAILVPVADADTMRDLPEAVLAAKYVPFPELFRHASAIVHHGGIGTTALAMRAGRPTLVVPTAWDQPDNAARAARLGVARVLPRARYSVRTAARELRSLLDNPTYSRRAAEIGVQVTLEDGARIACDALECLGSCSVQ